MLTFSADYSTLYRYDLIHSSLTTDRFRVKEIKGNISSPMLYFSIVKIHVLSNASLTDCMLDCPRDKTMMPSGVPNLLTPLSKHL